MTIAETIGFTMALLLILGMGFCLGYGVCTEVTRRK